MTSTYDSTGITLDRYADILARYVALAEAQWGSSIDTSEDEFYGHLIRMIALIQAEINQVVQDVYDAGSVSNATGTRLANLVELIGLEYQAAAYSTVTLTLTASKATTVPAGSQYKTSAGVVFATDSALVFTAAGSDTVTATCTVTGANNAAIGEVNTIVTAVYGITTVTNAAAATPGRLQETAAELKARHTIAVATSGDDDISSIYEAVSEVSGVSAVYCYDNDTDSTVDSVPAHTIRVSTVGGASADIAAAINNNKTCGVPTYGAQSASVYNTTTKQSKTIYWDTAVATPCHIVVTGTALSTYPDNGDALIKAALVAHFDNITINDDIIFTSLYEPIYSVGGLVVTDLQLGLSSPGSGTSNLTSTPLIQYTLATADIDVTVT